VGSLLLDVRRGDNLSGQMEPFAQVIKTLGSQGVVVVLPGELGLEVAAGGERLASLDDLECDMIVSFFFLVLFRRKIGDGDREGTRT